MAHQLGQPHAQWLLAWMLFYFVLFFENIGLLTHPSQDTYRNINARTR